MEQALNKFNVFIIENGKLQDALEFCKTLEVAAENMFVYEQLRIEDVRFIKDKTSVAVYEKQGFVFGEIGFDAQNALLKLLEESDELRYFVFYKSDNLLDTIQSRAQNITLHTKREIDSELIRIIEDGEIGQLIRKALLMQNMQKEDIIEILKGLSIQFSNGHLFDKAQIINERLLDFKRFNLNKKLFLFALFFKLSGGV